MDTLYFFIILGIIGLGILIWTFVDKPNKETHDH